MNGDWEKAGGVASVSGIFEIVFLILCSDGSIGEPGRGGRGFHIDRCSFYIPGELNSLISYLNLT